MLKLAIVIGSTRPGRVGEGVGQWVYKLAQNRKDAEFELVDVEDFFVFLAFLAPLAAASALADLPVFAFFVFVFGLSPAAVPFFAIAIPPYPQSTIRMSASSNGIASAQASCLVPSSHCAAWAGRSITGIALG